MTYKRGDIVMLPFPFSDLSSKKVRPALVISNSKMLGDDFLVCGITSRHSHHSVSINNEDMYDGTLPVQSYVRYDKLTCLDKQIVRKQVAHLNAPKMDVIVEGVMSLISA